MVEGDLTLERALDEHRDGIACLPPAKCRACALAPRHELEGASGDLLAGSGDSDDGHVTPAAVCGLERLTHDLGVACAVEGVVPTEASRAHAHQRLLEWLLRMIFRVDALCAPELLGNLELLWIHVDSDDGVGTDGLCSLDDGEADGSEAKDGHRREGLHLGGVPNRAKTGRDAAAKKTRLLRVHHGVDLGDGDLGEDGVLGEGRAAHEVPDGTAVLLQREARRAVGHHALSLRAADLRAEVSLWRHTEDTITSLALRRVAGHDDIAHRDGCDALANRLHNSRGLVSKDRREEPLRVRTPKGVHIRVAECIADHLHAHLTGLGVRDNNLLLAQIVDAEGDHRFARDGLVVRALSGCHGEEQD
mmetsp:Transcript_24028/g.61353  ORF Transcript_24028/g.61353 Transcript_24028/m.61353 type:complete len:362 (+) Transcript_24028:330-1415(+)